jgi:hypothetical protein
MSGLEGRRERLPLCVEGAPCGSGEAQGIGRVSQRQQMLEQVDFPGDNGFEDVQCAEWSGPAACTWSNNGTSPTLAAFSSTVRAGRDRKGPG